MDELERDGLRMTFASQHRSLEGYARALEDARLSIQRLREPRTRREHTRNGRWLRMPLFLHVDARKGAR